MRHVCRVFLVAVLCVLPVACGAAAEAQTAGGVQAWLPVPYTKHMTDTQVNALLDKAKSAGVDGVHTHADWFLLEPTKDSYQWAFMDRFVNKAKARNLQVTFQLSAAPRWVSPEGHWYPPRDSTDLAAWRDFTNDLVARYGTQVTRYEMWNEPNHPTFWPSGPNPTQYAALLRAGYLGAKAANPNVRVTAGALAHNDMGYLNALYTALRKYPDAAANDDFFNELAVHPYSHKGTIPLAPNSTTEVTFQADWGLRNTNFWGYRKMRDILVSRGDSHKKIYLGEFGYNTGPGWISPITDSVRADWLKSAFAVANSNSSYIAGLDWYSFYTDTERGYHIVNPNTLAETATFRALRDVAGGTTPTTQTLSFSPAADAFVQQGSPSRNFGFSNALVADADSGNWRMTFLQFNVSGVGTKTVQSAQLRLYVTSGGGSANGPGVRRSANTWTEGGVTWNNRPAHLTLLQGDKGAVAGGAWMTFDVTNLVRGDGTVTLAVQPTSSDGTYMYSREGTNKPQLVLNVG